MTFFGIGRREFDRAGEDNEVLHGNIRYDFLNCSRAAFVLDQRIQETATMDTIDIGPLGFVFSAEYDAVEMLGLDTQDAAGRQDCMIDPGKAAVGTWQNKVVQDVFAAFGQRGTNPELSDRASNIKCDVIRDRPKDQG